jgi:hypothetical protein
MVRNHGTELLRESAVAQQAAEDSSPAIVLENRDSAERRPPRNSMIDRV